MFNSTRVKLTALGALILGIAAVAVWFQPQKLFFDQTVNETLPPTATVSATQVPPSTAPTAEPESSETIPEAAVATASGQQFPVGEFIDLAHEGSGTAQIVELDDGSYVLRFENLDVFNGPDLRVILSAAPLIDDDGAYDDVEFLDLGDLKGNLGNQNYEIPAGTDLSKYETVAIWCRRFNVSFNAAEI
jgi:electron transfer DM13